LDFDEFGNPTDKSKIRGHRHRNTSYIEFNEENVDSVSEQFGGKYKP
jgi:hypothetical protein